MRRLGQQHDLRSHDGQIAFFAASLAMSTSNSRMAPAAPDPAFPMSRLKRRRVPMSTVSWKARSMHGANCLTSIGGMHRRETHILEMVAERPRVVLPRYADTAVRRVTGNWQPFSFISSGGALCGARPFDSGERTTFDATSTTSAMCSVELQSCRTEVRGVRW